MSYTKHELSGGVPEIVYRASRVARVIGNPTAYTILVNLLAGPMTPTALARRTNRSITTVSHTLAKLRAVDVVRYYRGVRDTKYGIKYGKSVAALLAALETLVQETFTNVPEQE